MNMKRKRSAFESIYKGPRCSEDDDDDSEVDFSNILQNVIGGKKRGKIDKVDSDANHIYFYSEVNRDSAFELINLLRDVDQANTSLQIKLGVDPIPIYLHIMSNGGCVFSAFNVIDHIKACKNPVYSVIEGSAASAATLISVVCDKRYVRPSAYMLIHQISSGWEGKMCELEDEMKNLKELTDTLKTFYKDNTNMTPHQLTSLLRRDLWLNAKKCIEYGLADELMS